MTEFTTTIDACSHLGPGRTTEMSFEQLGNIGDFLGGIAVIATLFYLSVQIRKQTREAKLSATRELAADFHATVAGLVHDKELLRVYLAGIHEYEALQDDDRLQLSLWFVHMFRVMEQQYLHTTHGTMDPVYFRSVNKAFIELLSFPGVQEWWKLTRNMFDDQFCSHVEDMIVESRELKRPSSFQKDI